MSALQEMSLADLTAFEAQLKAAKKAKQEQESVRYGSMLTEFVEDVVTSGEPIPATDKSTWTGFKVYGAVTRIDGKEYTVSVTITDVAAKAANDAAKAEAEKAAEAEAAASA